MVWNTDFLGRENFVRVGQLEINKNGLFCYVLQKRLGNIAFLLLMSAAGMAGAAAVLFAGWSGLTAGIILTVLSVRYGLKGVFWFCGCILPQQIFLVPGFLMMMEWCCQKKSPKKMMVPLMTVLMGCVLEAYLNPTFLQLILRIFPV